MKNIRFYTITVLFDKLPTPKVNRCLHMDIRYSTFDIGSHVISCLRELGCIIVVNSGILGRFWSIIQIFLYEWNFKT